LKILIVVTLGIATSILVHGNWLFIDNQIWTKRLTESSLFLYLAENHHEGWNYALISTWFILPLLLPITVLLTLTINKLELHRLFIYSVLITSAFMFVILPRLPIFDVLLIGLDSYMNVIYYQITPLTLFLLIFYITTFVIINYHKLFKRGC